MAGLIREALGEERAVLGQAEVIGRLDRRVGMKTAPAIKRRFGRWWWGLVGRGWGWLRGGDGRVTPRASSGRVQAEGEGAEGRGGSAAWTLRGLLDDLRFTGAGLSADGKWSFDGMRGCAERGR